MSASGDRSSVIRKRALRRLGREQSSAYAEIYEKVRPSEPTGAHARSRARTLLRQQFPDRYLELFAEEQAAPPIEIPPGIRSKSWARATARLADLRAEQWRESYDRLRAQGLPRPRAWERAVAPVRRDNASLFTQLLSEEYRLWIFATELTPGPSR